MPRTKETNQNIRATKQSQILDAARHVFARRGWSATMNEIAEAAGVSQGLAYRYFDGKEAMYNALIEEIRKPDLVNPFLTKEKSPYDRLHLLITLILESDEEYMEFYQILVNAIQDERVPEQLRNALYDYGQRFRTFLRNLIEEGQAIGEVVEGNSEQLATAVRGCLNGLSKIAIDGQFAEQPFPTADIVLRLIRK